MLRSFMCAVCAVFFTGCVTTGSNPKTSTSTSSLQSLSSSVSLTLHAKDHALAGSGYIVFKHPDKAHIVVLSPFGTILFETYIIGNRISMIYPSDKIAFSGLLSELPSQGGFREWRAIHWVLADAAAIQGLVVDGTVERNTADGGTETATVTRGLVVKKSNQHGDTVYYDRHEAVHDVLLAHEIDLRNNSDEQLRIILDEPEVNTQLENAAFIPKFEGLKVYPLQALEQK